MKKIKSIQLSILLGFAGICLFTACKKLKPAPKSADTPSVIVSTVAGNRTQGSSDGTGTSATFFFPAGVAVDATGNLYITDAQLGLIRKITPSAVVTTLAGSGAPGNTDGTGAAASFAIPLGIAIDANGNLYIAEQGNEIIRKVTATGVVTLFAGTLDDHGLPDANIDGTGSAAGFIAPVAVAVDPGGNIIVADKFNIRKITPAAVVTTFAGNGTNSFLNGTGTSAGFSGLSGVAVDAQNNIYVADAGNNVVRKITAAGVVTTLAGSGSSSYANGTGKLASFTSLQGIAVDTHGIVYVSDASMIRRITPSGVVTTLAGSSVNRGAVDGKGDVATFNTPLGIGIDSKGNLYIADNGNNLIRKITFP
jgi:sugar lactone lactonase YvrE